MSANSRPRQDLLNYQQEDTMGDLLQLSMLLGAAAVGLRALTRLVVTIWSLRADASGRRHALRLLKALDREWATRSANDTVVL